MKDPIDAEQDELKRNHCNTIKVKKDGTKVLKPKRVFEDLDEAIKACKWLNVQPNRTDKVVSYKCVECHKYHIGRNGKTLTSKYKTKLAKEIIQVKIVGQIDLSTINDKRKKPRFKKK